jgi:hypothetical protein
VSATKREVILILLGVVALVLALVVLIRNRSLDVDLLAGIAIVGGVAMIVVSLPGSGK